MSPISRRYEFTQRPRAVVIVVPLTIVSTLILANLRNTDVPFVLIFLVGALWTGTFLLVSGSAVLRNATLFGVAFFLGLAVVEYGAYILIQYKFLNIKNHGIWRRVNIGLGLENVPNATAESREFFRDQLVFDVTYSINAKGLRRIPDSVQGSSAKVEFFGCSYMFGHGLNNDQTIPYFFLHDAHGTFEGFNFSAHGWGAHQMLRELQTGLVSELAGHPQLAFYEGLTDHIKRAATGAYEPFGPRYILTGGTLSYLGPFHGTYYKIFLRYFTWNWTFHLIQNDLQKSEPNASEIPLYVAIMTRAKGLLEESGTRFVVVFWDKGQLAQTIVRILEANGFEVVRVSQIIPDFSNDPTKYQLSPFDDHPSAKANRLIGNYLWQRYGEPVLAESLRKAPHYH